MTPRQRAAIQLLILVVVVGALILLFPKAYAFTEIAARELRYFWWVVLLVALAVWLIWGFKRRR